MTDTDKLSRADVETLCLLHAVGRDGARAATVTDRLGLSPAATGAVTSALCKLIALELVDLDADWFRLSPEGARRL